MTDPVKPSYDEELLEAKRRLIRAGYYDVFDTAVLLETDQQRRDTPFRQAMAQDDTDAELETPVPGSPLQLTSLDQDDDHKTKVMLQHLNLDLVMSDRWIDQKLKNINRKILRGEY
jgi:hypothetical protein